MALPLCGRAARGKRRGGDPAGAQLPPLSSLSTGAKRLVRLGFRDSYNAWPRRSSGNGGEPSQPRPEPGSPAASAAGVLGKGRAADEAAARRKQRACPCAEAKAAGFESAHPDPKAFGPTGFGQRRGGTSVAPMPAAAGFRPAHCHRRGGLRPGFVGQDRVSARELRNGGPGFRSMTAMAEPRLRPRILPDASQGLRPEARQGRKRCASAKSAERRTARASALVGEPAGTPAAAPGRGRTPEEAALSNPRFGKRRRLETAPRGTPRLPGWVPRKGTVGAGGDAGPHYFSGRWAATSASPARFGRSVASAPRLAAGRLIRAANQRGWSVAYREALPVFGKSLLFLPDQRSKAGAKPIAAAISFAPARRA